MKIIKLFSVLSISILLLFGCSSKSADNIFNEATSLIQQKKYNEALNKFKTVVEQFPSSPKTADAMFEIAKLYQGKVVKNIGEKESLVEAVKYYKKVYDNFPNSKIAPKSLFMAGFIEANELNDYDSAKKTYNTYLEKYPKDELVKDAKVELQNLGKSPEEILKERLQESKK